MVLYNQVNNVFNIREIKMTIQDIMNQLKDIKGEYLNGNITSEEMIEALEDLIHDVQGNDEYQGFGTSMEDDGFYDTMPDFSELVVD
tara:strand:+ start:766 stop:1026 length:261 start_codon:yes stop_codon:yes gene_type:complete